MNCTNCNASVPDNSKFCPDCGTRFTAATLGCSRCGELQPASSKFCANCGLGFSQPPSIGRSASAQTEPQPFVRLLSDEAMRSLPTDPVSVPYGCAAVIVVDGIVQKIQRQPASEASNGSVLKGFFRGLSDLVHGLVGQNKHQVRTYLFSDYTNLPFVSCSRKLQIPGSSEGRLRFDVWIDFDQPKLEAIGLFLHHVLGNRPSLTVQEFHQAATGELTRILAGFDERELLSRESQDKALDLLVRQCGISGQVRFQRGRSLGQRNLEVGQFFSAVQCGGCGTPYRQMTKFCEQCGTNLSNADWAGATRGIAAAGGEALVLRLHLLGEMAHGEVAPDWSDDAISESIYSMLEPTLRKMPLDSLMTGRALDELNQVLARGLYSAFQGQFSEAKVLDVRTAEEDWFFKTDALIADALRKIETDRRLLAVDEGRINYEEAAFAISLRRLQQQDSQELTERRARLASRRDALTLDVDEHQMEVNAALRMEAIDHAAEQDRFNRGRDTLLRDRGLERELRAGDRADETVELRHEQSLERSAAQHDVELADLAGEARSRSRRRDIGDSSFEAEEALRLRASERAQLGNIEEDLADRQNQRQVDKMRAMAELEANMARQDQDFELQKIVGMKSLDAQQILAMQAAQLAKVAGAGGAADIVKSIAQSQADAASSDLKEAMYKQMLEIQERAADKTAQAQREALDTMLRSNSDLTRMNSSITTNVAVGYKEAAQIARSTNEKSMDAMSKVATAAAARKPVRDEAAAEPQLNSQCGSCDHVYEGKKKFCPQCGAPQS